MDTLNIPHAVRRAVWTLLVFCVPVVLQAAEVSKFLASGNRAYLEVTVDKDLQKIYTEYHGDSTALLVLGARDNPELLTVSLVDSSKKIATYRFEFRAEKEMVSPGHQVGNEFIRSLKSDAGGFQDWQARFSTLPDEPTWSDVIVDPSVANPIGVDILDGDTIEFRLSNWVCQCQREQNPVACGSLTQVDLCVLDNLCTIWQCIEAGELTPACLAAFDAIKACRGEFE